MARSENEEVAGAMTRFVADLVRAMREQHGLSQVGLGEIIGHTGSAISAVETCVQPPSDEMLVKLEEAIGGGLAHSPKMPGVTMSPSKCCPWSAG